LVNGVERKAEAFAGLHRLSAATRRTVWFLPDTWSIPIRQLPPSERISQKTDLHVVFNIGRPAFIASSEPGENLQMLQRPCNGNATLIAWFQASGALPAQCPPILQSGVPALLCAAPKPSQNLHSIRFM
jgi:hypothetical protein